MKCEKCNEREANFYYSVNINGKKTERHLCTQCAKEEGLMESLRVPAFDDIFDMELLPSFGSIGKAMRRIMSPGFGLGSFAFPELSFALPGFDYAPETASPERAEDSESKIPSDAGADIRRRREIEALRSQMKSAVEAEDFEKAIELRDKLKGLEQ